MRSLIPVHCRYILAIRLHQQKIDFCPIFYVWCILAIWWCPALTFFSRSFCCVLFSFPRLRYPPGPLHIQCLLMRTNFVRPCSNFVHESTLHPLTSPAAIANSHSSYTKPSPLLLPQTIKTFLATPLIKFFTGRNAIQFEIHHSSGTSLRTLTFQFK